MLKTTIENLWCGNLAPLDKCGVGDSEVKRLFALRARNEEKLMENLNEIQRSIFEKYQDSTEEYMYLCMSHAFSEGFSLASKLLTEALSIDG